MIRILAFGIAKEITGSATMSMGVNENITVEALKERLKEAYPELRRLSAFMIAVNGEYAVPGTILTATDEIAIIPPVSGG